MSSSPSQVWVHVESRGIENFCFAQPLNQNSFPNISTRGSGYEFVYGQYGRRTIEQLKQPI